MSVFIYLPLYCEMGKKEQVPARAIFVQGSLWDGRLALAVFHIVPRVPAAPNLFVHILLLFDLRNVGPAPSLVSPRAHRRARQSGLSREVRARDDSSCLRLVPDSVYTRVCCVHPGGPDWPGVA